MASDKGVQDENELCVMVELPATGAETHRPTDGDAMHAQRVELELESVQVEPATLAVVKGSQPPEAEKLSVITQSVVETETPVTKRKRILTPKAQT